MALLLPPLPPTFAAALRDVHARAAAARIQAAERLATPDAHERADAIVGLQTMAFDRDGRVRAAALRAFAELAAPELADAARACLDDSDALVRELALIALAAICPDGARPALLEALTSAHPELRFQAIAGLAEQASPDDLPCVAALLDDPDVEVRAHAARHLFAYGDSSREPLRRAAGDANASVRGEAALSLARLGDASGAHALPDALDNPELVFEALDVAGDLGRTELRDRIAAIAEGTFQPLPLKAAAARALLRLQDARGIPILRGVLRAFRSSARTYAVQITGELRIAALTQDVVRLTRRERGVDPQALVEALSQLAQVSDLARMGLEALARRGDDAGLAARRRLSVPAK